MIMKYALGANSEFGIRNNAPAVQIRNSEFGIRRNCYFSEATAERYIREKVISARAECAFGARSEVGKKVGGRKKGRRSEVGIRRNCNFSEAKPMRYIKGKVTSANAERERL